MRAVIYARYSTDLQSEASIEDQVRLCRARIASEGWSLVITYTDHAISGASRLRPGYQKLLEDARAGSIDVVVAEALDRLSRDQEDIAALYKQLGFAGVRLVTIGINPHAFRDALAASVALANLAKIAHASAILGHSGTTATNAHYNQTPAQTGCICN
jgi:DNA invertase Pin-like site-specific DNA recombinase